MKRTPENLQAHVESMVIRRDGCWEWQQSRQANGYAQTWDGNTVLYVHRLMYEWYKGPIPKDLEIDHLCRNRGCVNPEHLEAVTRRVNQHRGQTLAARMLSKAACPRGHIYDSVNTYWTSLGHRICRTCNRQRAHFRRQGLLFPSGLPIPLPSN